MQTMRIIYIDYLNPNILHCQKVYKRKRLNSTFQTKMRFERLILSNGPFHISCILCYVTLGSLQMLRVPLIPQYKTDAQAWLLSRAHGVGYNPIVLKQIWKMDRFGENTYRLKFILILPVLMEGFIPITLKHFP